MNKARKGSLSLFKKKLEDFIQNIWILEKKIYHDRINIIEECEELATKEEEEKNRRLYEREREKRKAKGLEVSSSSSSSSDEEEKGDDGSRIPISWDIQTVDDIHRIPDSQRRGYEFLLYEEEISTQADTDSNPEF